MMIIITLVTAVLTYQVCQNVLRDHSHFGSPRFLAVLVATLCGLSLFRDSDGVKTVILLPYAALGLAILLLWLFRFLIGNGVYEHVRRFFHKLADDKPHERITPQKDVTTGKTTPRRSTEPVKRKE